MRNYVDWLTKLDKETTTTKLTGTDKINEIAARRCCCCCCWSVRGGECQSVIQYSGNQLAKLQDNRGNKHTHVIISKWLIALVIYLTLDDFAKSLSQPLHFGSISVFTRSFAFQCSVWLAKRSLIYVEFVQRLSINTAFSLILCACMHIGKYAYGFGYTVPLGFSRDLCSARNCFSTFYAFGMSLWRICVNGCVCLW